MTTTRRLGLILFGVLSVGDLTALALTDGSHPPYSVAAMDAVLGLASLYLIVEVWRGRPRRLLPLLVLRIVSAVSAAPAFFGSGVPAAAIAAAAAIVVLTVVGVLLVAPARSSKAPARSSKVAAR